jgi:ribosome maturation factor RimP
MTPSATAEALRAGLSAPLATLGVDLEGVEVHKAGRRHVVRVVVDRDGGVDLDLVAAVSRRVSELLDVPPLSESMPGPFVLEVTSPGIDRPLSEPRHWRRAIGRLVNVTMIDDSVVAGRVVDVPSQTQAVLATSTGDVVVALPEVRRALVEVEFNRPDQPVDEDAVNADVDGDDDDDDGTDPQDLDLVEEQE